MSTSVRVQILVSGRVQGVGYRYFVIEVAERLGLNGWVRNLADGRVEAQVEGEQESVDQLVSEMRAGPRLSHVTDLKIIPLDNGEAFHGFRVR